MTAQLEEMAGLAGDRPVTLRIVDPEARWLAAFARGLATSDLSMAEAADELRRAAGHDATDALRAARALLSEDTALAVVEAALALEAGARRSADLDLVDRLLANADLFDDPGAYAAGVRDAVAALGRGAD